MRTFIFAIVILVSVPAYAVGQQRDRSERSATGRTAEPREKEKAAHAAPDKETDRRGERRGQARRYEIPQPAPAATQRTNLPRLGRSPASIAWPNYVPPVPDRDHRRPRRRAPNVVFVPYVAPVVVEREVIVERKVVAGEDAAPVFVEPPSLARLILDVHPPTAQIFADGYYIGMPQDFRLENGGAVMEPGPHRIDILDRDYEPVSFEVNLTRGQSATYRQMMTPIGRTPQPALDAAATAQPEPKKASTFYLIPGCYMGNVPPTEANLPATCDVARVVTFQY